VLKKLKSTKGGVVILIVMMLVILFPIILSSIIDLSNIYKISKILKNALNASVKSASSRIDWTKVHDGIFEIDVAKAQSAFKDIMDLNLNIDMSYNGHYFVYDNDDENKHIRVFMAIYNSRHTGSFVDFPVSGTIPPEVYDKPISVQVDRPTVFAIATVDYQLMPIFGRRVIHITEVASSQLNVIKQ